VIAATKETAAVVATTVPIAAHGTAALADPTVEHLEAVPEDHQTAVDMNATQLLKQEKINEGTVIYHHSE